MKKKIVAERSKGSYPDTKYKGRIALITNPRNKYYGEKVVIQYTSPSGKSFLVRRLIPSSDIERLTFANGRVNGATARYLAMRVAATSIEIKAAKTTPVIKDWETETLKFMDPYIGMTKKQVDKILK